MQPGASAKKREIYRRLEAYVHGHTCAYLHVDSHDFETFGVLKNDTNSLRG